MQTDSNAIKTIVATDILGAHFIGTVIEKTAYLLNSIEATTVASLFSKLLYYVGNPEAAEELSKEEFVNLTSDSFILVECLTELRVACEDFCNRVERGGHE
jgi:hypothetical protein